MPGVYTPQIHDVSYRLALRRRQTLPTAASGIITGSGIASLGGLTGTGTGVRTVLGTGLVSLGSLTGTAAGLIGPLGAGTALLGGVAGTATGVVTAVEVPRGSWQTLVDIMREARELAAADAAAPWVACPNDGEPLRAGPHGEQFCPWDGWQP